MVYTKLSCFLAVLMVLGMFSGMYAVNATQDIGSTGAKTLKTNKIENKQDDITILKGNKVANTNLITNTVYGFGIKNNRVISHQNSIISDSVRYSDDDDTNWWMQYYLDIFNYPY